MKATDGRRGISNINKHKSGSQQQIRLKKISMSFMDYRYGQDYFPAQGVAPLSPAGAPWTRSWPCQPGINDIMW